MDNKNIVLIVDDVEVNRVILRELFQDTYTIEEAENGLEALNIVFRNPNAIAVILLDIVMPVLDGFAVLNKLLEEKLLTSIPVVLITAENSGETEIKGLGLGASDVVSKPFDPFIVERRVENIIELYRHKTHLENMVERQTRRLRETNDFIVDALSTVIEYRNMESGQHIRRIRVFTKLMMEAVSKSYTEYHMTPETIRTISSASAMHDIGKIVIPDAVLLKPGRLTAEEFEIMKTHTTKGCEILKILNRMEDKEYLMYCYNICRYHHERWDGRGYPDGLKGDEIPICAQVVAVADVYDALTNDRVYKPAIPHDEAVQMILNGECGTFSPKLMECFKSVREHFRQLAADYGDGKVQEEDYTPPARTSYAEKELEEDDLDTETFGHMKYFTALKYLDARVTELDLNTGMYHVVYRPEKDTEALSASGSYEEYYRHLVEQSVHPNDRENMKQGGISYLLKAYQQGKWKVSVEFRKYHLKSGTYKWYSNDALRIDTGNPSAFKVLLFTKNIDTSKTLAERNLIDKQQYLYALQSNYIAVYTMNLTTNTFVMLSAGKGLEKEIRKEGSYSREFAHSMEEGIHPNDRDAFANQLCLENLAIFFRDHDKELIHQFRRLEEDEKYYWTEIAVVKVENNQNDDLLVMAFIRNLESQTDETPQENTGAAKEDTH